MLDIESLRTGANLPRVQLVKGTESDPIYRVKIKNQQKFTFLLPQAEAERLAERLNDAVFE